MVFALGAQYQPISKFFFRAGYNYGKTPVDDNDGFDGTAPKSVHFFVDITCHIVAFWVEWYIVVFNARPSQQIIIPFSTGRLSIIYFLKRNDTPRPFKSSTQFSELYKFLAILPALKKNRTIR
jgi:hypothetical protein